MNKVQSKFLSAFAGGAIVSSLIMEETFSYQNIFLSISLGLFLALILMKCSPRN